MKQDLRVPPRVAPLDQWVAIAATVGVAAFWPIAGPFSTAFVIPLVIFPLWAPALRQPHLTWVGVLATLAIVNGLVLGQVMSTGARIQSTSLALAQGALLASLILGACVLTWARNLLGAGRVAALFGLGVLMGQVRIGFSEDNIWKYNLFVPVCLIVLGWAWTKRDPRIEMGALAVIAAASIINDSRSAAAMAAVSLVAMIWQHGRVHLKIRSSRIQVVATLGAVGVTMYLLMQAFILEGYLGAATQARSQEQIRASGSLLLGGRPEMGATAALLEASPSGYGMGIIPGGSDVWVAKSGMAALNYDPDNGYVERYMFGEGMEVHSVIGDLWLRHGLAGLGFGLTLVAVVMMGGVTRLAQGRASGLVVLLTLTTTWDAFFSPFYVTAIRVAMVALAFIGEGIPPPKS